MELFASQALLPSGWARNVRLSIAADGTLRSVQPDAAENGAQRVAGPLVPGMPNLHSHAFQRAMAGTAEVVGDLQDSFWSWRRRMYDLVARMTPDAMEAVATYLYMEMLKAGYTSVAEFHYLHHDQDGRPYADTAETAERVMAGAATAGIAHVLAPVLYSHGGFGGQPAAAGQRRFVHDTDSYATLWQTLCSRIAAHERQSLALCFHSLRAVTHEQIQTVLTLNDRVPVHIHIAEQQAEVEASLAWSGQRPVAWLYDHVDVDERWCLVHATHLTGDEVRKIATSNAVVGLCPSTEANLGDGIFPATDYVAASGRFGIGSDSHISVNVTEELRWLEYGQRLVTQRRNRLHGSEQSSVGRFLYEQALQGGAQALGQWVGRIEAGAHADFVVLNGDNPFIATANEDQLLDRWLFALGNEGVRDVYVSGRRVIEAGRHPREQRITAAFGQAIQAAG